MVKHDSRPIQLPPPEPPPDERVLVTAVVDAAVLASRNRRALPPSRFEVVAELSPEAVDAELERHLRYIVGRLWEDGWQPAELLRHGRRTCTKPGARLLAQAIAADHANRRATTLDVAWMAQVDDLHLPPTDGRPGWVRRWERAEALHRVDAVTTAIGLIVILRLLPKLEVLLPPPGSDPRVARIITGGTVDAVLQKVRALLAKAESTTFEAEASAFTAKAQELIARHAIDTAVLESSSHVGERPISTRLPIDDPYVDAKVMLLHGVATAGRCRTVFHSSVALATIVGFEADISAVELLFTSLLVQAQRALEDAGTHAPPGTRVRSRGYRSAFLMSYAHRIGARLLEVQDAVVAEAAAERGASLLPALQARTEAVDDAVDERFGDSLTRTRLRSGTDPAGWAGGRQAADNARLTAADLEQPI